MNNQKDFATRIVDGVKVGIIKRPGRQFFVLNDVVICGDILGQHEVVGEFINGSLENIPKEYVKEVAKILEKLTYMHSVLSKQ